MVLPKEYNVKIAEVSRTFRADDGTAITTLQLLESDAHLYNSCSQNEVMFRLGLNLITGLSYGPEEQKLESAFEIYKKEHPNCDEKSFKDAFKIASAIVKLKT